MWQDGKHPANVWNCVQTSEERGVRHRLPACKHNPVKMICLLRQSVSRVSVISSPWPRVKSTKSMFFWHLRMCHIGPHRIKFPCFTCRQSHTFSVLTKTPASSSLLHTFHSWLVWSRCWGEIQICVRQIVRQPRLSVSAAHAQCETRLVSYCSLGRFQCQPLMIRSYVKLIFQP